MYRTNYEPNSYKNVHPLYIFGVYSIEYVKSQKQNQGQFVFVIAPKKNEYTLPPRFFFLFLEFSVTTDQ